MENRNQLSLLPEITDIISKLFDVQNKGLATVFIDIAGHVGLVEYRIYAPVWVTDASPSFKGSFYIDIDTKEDADEDYLRSYFEQHKAELLSYIDSLTKQPV